MRALVERVAQARVVVEGKVVGDIQAGVLVYLGVAGDDGESDIAYLSEKIANLRIFNDSAGKMNLSVKDIQGQALVISAFALQADARKGRRPSFDQAADPHKAKTLYEQFCQALGSQGIAIQTGIFRAHMEVTCTNDGPICILLDSQRLF